MTSRRSLLKLLASAALAPFAAKGLSAYDTIVVDDPLLEVDSVLVKGWERYSYTISGLDAYGNKVTETVKHIRRTTNSMALRAGESSFTHIYSISVKP